MSESTTPEIQNEKAERGKAEAGRYLSFSLGNEEYAIPLSRVRQVIAVPPITPIPGTPSHMLGIMNLRGQVLSIMDLGAKLRIKDLERGSETAVVILDLVTASLGIVVTSVNNVLALSTEQISERPQAESTHENDFFSGVAKKDENLILMLDLAKLLSTEDIRNFTHERNAA